MERKQERKEVRDTQGKRQAEILRRGRETSGREGEREKRRGGEAAAVLASVSLSQSDQDIPKGTMGIAVVLSSASIHQYRRN